MHFKSTDPGLAAKLDSNDELASFRDLFVIDDADTIYLDGNSLGRLPKATVSVMRDIVERAWGQQLIRSWNQDWIDLPLRLGAKIASLVGAQPDEIVITDATSVNLFKLAVAALEARPGRTTIVSDVLNFPSDLYILQGSIRLLGDRHRLALAPSPDGVSVSPESIQALVDDKTALLCLTHVAFKSAFMHDMAHLTEQAHQAGALALWDLSHSVGAVPLKLNQWNVDLAVGCTYKYLNGGPGSPAFVYVRRDLQQKLRNPICGWLAAEAPFAFELDFTPDAGIGRFTVGAPPILSMKALEPSLDILQQAGIDRLRAKSLQQTEYLIFLAEQMLEPLGFGLGSPRQPQMRGSHVSLRHQEGYRICRALIEPPPGELCVIPDFRTPDNIRLGVAPLYNTFTDIHRALVRMRDVVQQKIYLDYSDEHPSVT
jgi:kynureninase